MEREYTVVITKEANLEQVEQSLFDSVKQNDTEKVSTNVKK